MSGIVYQCVVQGHQQDTWLWSGTHQLLELKVTFQSKHWASLVTWHDVSQKHHTNPTWEIYEWFILCVYVCVCVRVHVYTWELMSSRRSRRMASRRSPTTALSTKKQLSLAWTQRWQRWSRTVCHTQDTRSLQTQTERERLVLLQKYILKISFFF